MPEINYHSQSGRGERKKSAATQLHLGCVDDASLKGNLSIKTSEQKINQMV